jgi:uncharacterized DUF497 family protein
MKSISALAILLSFLVSSASDAADDFFCYAPIFAYKTTAPKGWKLDTQSGKAHNLCIVGYPEGGSWAESKTLVYFSAISKDKGSETLQSVVKNDLVFHKKASPGVDVKEAEIVEAGARKIPTKHFFEQTKNGRYEAVGYIDEPKAVIMAVMSATNEVDFEKALPAFRKLIQSYKTVPPKKISKN